MSGLGADGSGVRFQGEQAKEELPSRGRGRPIIAQDRVQGANIGLRSGHDVTTAGEWGGGGGDDLSFDFDAGDNRFQGYNLGDNNGGGISCFLPGGSGGRGRVGVINGIVTAGN